MLRGHVMHEAVCRIPCSRPCPRKPTVCKKAKEPNPRDIKAPTLHGKSLELLTFFPAPACLFSWKYVFFSYTVYGAIHVSLSSSMFQNIRQWNPSRSAQQTLISTVIMSHCPSRFYYPACTEGVWKTLNAPSSMSSSNPVLQKAWYPDCYVRALRMPKLKLNLKST